MKNRLVLTLYLASLLFVSASIFKASCGENIALKVSDDLKATLSKLNLNDPFLLWLDVYIPPLPDGNVYLHSNDLSPITHVGAKIAGMTFSPDKQLLWCLVETHPAQVACLASLSMVRRVSLAMIGGWEWWDKNWRSETMIDPFLNLTIQRANNDFPDVKVPVVISYSNAEQNKTRENEKEILPEIKRFVELVGGEVEYAGVAEYVFAKFPADTVLSRFTENKHIRTLESCGLICARECSFRKSISDSQSQLMYLLPLCAVCCSIRKVRKIKSVLIISLLVTCFLVSYNVPSYALNVSRSAIRADQTGYDGSVVVVAIIDYGIDFNNPYLAPAILANVDFTGTGAMDYDGHGTHVAGIIASRSGTYTGIAPGSNIINLKVDENVTNSIRAIQWCIDNKDTFNISVINFSLGEYLEQQSDGTDPLSKKADDAVEAGITVVVAVNEVDSNYNTMYELSNPEQAFNVIAVGAVNDNDTADINDDTLAYYSGRGPTGASSPDSFPSESAKRPKPDVVAPGDRNADPFSGRVGIWSTRSANASDNAYEAVNDVYGRMSGTSMAAPHVSGTVALMLEANPNLTPAQVKAILRQTARLNDNLNALTINDRGYGIIDAYAAVQLAQNVSNINKTLMYDSWKVKTPFHYLGDPQGSTGECLNFTVDPPSSTFGIALSNIDYTWWGWYGVSTVYYRLLNRISAQHIWIDDTYYDLGSDMNKYLLSGPRIAEKDDGFIVMHAVYKVNDVPIYYQWWMDVNETYPCISFWLWYNGGSSWKTLIYVDTNVWDTTNYAYMPSTNETIYYERNVSGDVNLKVRDTGHTDYVEIDPFSYDSSTMWILKYGYTGNNPDTALNDEYTYDRDIVIYCQETAIVSGVDIYRRTDSLPAPDPPPTTPSKPSGNTSGYTYTNYTYTTNSTDPGDSIHYEFDWGDGSRTWTGWNASGETAGASHNWTSPGTYQIKVRAQDSNNAWSDWSSPFNVSIISLYLTVRTYVIGGSEINNVKVWVDSDPARNSPMTIPVSPGMHIVQVEPYFYRQVYWLYTFHNWWDINSTSNTRDVPVSGNVTIRANYTETYCPTLFVWNGTDYAYEALLNIHAETDITVQHNITQPLVKDGIFYKLSLRELDEFTSHIDQVKLYVVDSNGEWHICPLVSAVHSEQGWVTLQLRFDDETRVNLHPTETIDLKFTYFGHDIEYFIFEINGYNKKIP